MTDRELLEKAAKAAGGIHLLMWCGTRGWLRDGEPRDYWNPLKSDGDALRLAVKLRINLCFEEYDGAEYACAVPSKSHQGCDEVVDDDDMRSTRRAIVRAAAAMAQEGCGMTYPVLWRCGECDRIVRDEQLLKANNPFGGCGKVIGCPHCKEVADFTNMCDEPHCKQQASGGFPTKDGYRHTCSIHRGVGEV